MLNFATYISLLGVLSQSLASSNIVNQKRQASGPSSAADDVPADAKRLPMDCQDILYSAGVTAGFKASAANIDNYFVGLKLSTTAKDVTDVLALPYMKGVKAIQTYTQDYDRGFVAKLTYDQVCSVYKEARISTVQVCEGNACAPEQPPAKKLPGPSKNSGIQGAPDITGLSEQCARTVWYTNLEYNPATTDTGKYDALTKVHVSQKDADAFFASQPGTIRNATAESHGWYAGKWSYTQLCDIEKSALVSRVETVPKPGLAPKWRH